MDEKQDVDGSSSTIWHIVSDSVKEVVPICLTRVDQLERVDVKSFCLR